MENKEKFKNIEYKSQSRFKVIFNNISIDSVCVRSITKPKYVNSEWEKYTHSI